MPRVNAKAAMKVILSDESKVMPRNESDMDKTPLDIAEFVNSHNAQRRKMLGLPSTRPILDPKDIVVAPQYKYSIIKNYAELPKNFRHKAMNMFSEGMTATEIQAKFGIAPKSWNLWLAQNSEFAEFVSMGMARAQAWWEAHARAFVNQPASRFNVGLFAINMENRFPEHYKKDRGVGRDGVSKVLVGHVLLPPLAEDPRAAQKFIEAGTDATD
jgi:hypothetical protein